MDDTEYKSFLERELQIASAHNLELRTVLDRCRTLLTNMTLENESRFFKRWQINHEPLREDAKNILSAIDTLDGTS